MPDDKARPRPTAPPVCTSHAKASDVVVRCVLLAGHKPEVKPHEHGALRW